MIGLAVAFAGGRAAASVVYGLSASDPIVLASATAIVALIALVATAVPAQHAARTSPVRALRSE